MPTNEHPSSSDNKGEHLPKVKVHGRIGQVYPAEVIVRKDGLPDLLVFRFSLATHESTEDTVWYRVATFDEKAQAMQERFRSGELRVGQEVRIEGRLREQHYVSRRTGQPGIDRQIFPFEVHPVPQAPKL